MTETKTKHTVSCFIHLIGIPCGCDMLGKSESKQEQPTLNCTDRWGTCEADEKCYFDEKYAPKCEACVDLDELEKEFPDEPHHGAVLTCGECNAEYFEEYGGTRYAAKENEQAQINHPELKTL